MPDRSGFPFFLSNLLPRQRLYRTLLLTAACSVFTSALPAATMVNYQFTGGSASPTSVDPDMAASFVASNIGVLGTDSGFSSSSNNAFVRGNATPSLEADAVTGGIYFQFTLTPNVAIEADLSQLTVNFGNAISSGSFTGSFFVRSSANGYASNIPIISTTGTTTFSGNVASRTTSSASTSVSDIVTFDLSEAGFQNLASSLTFRLYVFDTSVSSQAITRFDNITVSGTVSPVPEASAPLLFGGAVGLLLMFRRRGVLCGS